MELLNNAIDNLEKNIPLNWDWKTIKTDKKEVDGELKISINNQKATLFVAIKKDIRSHQLYDILKHKNKFTNYLLVAEKLYPNIKKELRDNHVNYLEGNGNVYINTPDIFLYIDKLIYPSVRQDHLFLSLFSMSYWLTNGFFIRQVSVRIAV